MPRLLRWRLTRAAGVAFVLGLLLVGSPAAPVTPSFAAVQHRVPPSAKDYLALGDSVTFGFREQNTSPPPNYLNAASFVGFPEDVGMALGLQVANAACPGETTTSLIEPKVLSNGCENAPGGLPGYRTVYPLHVNYPGTQLQYAIHYLRTHPHTGLVTLMIGANDAFLCQETTSDSCASELSGVLSQISQNVANILTAIREVANYKRQIVIVNYYSLNYADPVATAGSEELNQAVDQKVKPFDVQIADGFGAFQAAAQQSGGNTCTAGLLTQTTGGGCGIHPSLAGQALLALAVEEVIRR
jgi:lysophospholipase L1-like esterase